MAISRPFRIYPRQASVPRNQSNKRLTVPPPIGGWNARDEPSQMSPTDAGDLINLIPRRGFVQMRGGYEAHSTGVGAGNVDLCVEFNNGTVQRLISASSSTIYNSTSSGAASSLGTGFSSGRWDTATMNGVMAFVNGVDTPQKYDGTTLTTLSTTGPTATSLIGVHVFKARSYFWESGGRSFWYSATNTLGATLTEFALGEISKKGGRLMRMTSWTIDGGSGPDDYAVFIMENGEVIVYQGDDPGSANAWSLVGVYELGSPVNDRAFAKLGGEVAIINENDIVFLPSAFDKVAPTQTKLQTAIADAVLNFGSNDGWQVFQYPNERLLILNIPVATSPDLFDQYVMDTSTFAACRFTNIPARCWGLFNGGAYFGSTDGTVYRFNTVASDAGADIDCVSVQGWTDLGIPENKTITAVRPVFEVQGSMSIGVGTGYDFEEPTVSSPSSASSGGTVWGSSWGSPWNTDTEIQAEWEIVGGRGSHLSMTVKFSRQGDSPRWLRTDWLVKQQGNL